MAEPIRKRDKPRATYRNGKWTVHRRELRSSAPELKDALEGFRVVVEVEKSYAQRRGA